MKSWEKLSAICPVLLTAFLLCLPARVRGAGNGLGLSFRLHGGFSYLAAADANAGAKGWPDFVEYIASISGGIASGGYNPFHGGPDLGADVIVRLSTRIGIGLGVGYLRSSSLSSMDFTRPGEDHAVIKYTPTLSAIPIRLGVFATWPLRGKWNLTANAGAAYYAAVTFKFLERNDDLIGGTWTESLFFAKTNRLGNIGFQGGVGLEYEISGPLLLFIEAQGRYARFKNFDRATASTTSIDGSYPPVVGKIYLDTATFPSWPEPLTSFILVQGTPKTIPGVDEIREPTFDFSGFSLQFGFRVRL